MSVAPRTRILDHHPHETPMATKCRSRPDPFFPDLEPLADLLRTPPCSTEDRLRHIRALGRRISEYIRFMSTVSKWGPSSEEERDRAVAVFCQRLRIMEQELSRLHDEFRPA